MRHVTHICATCLPIHLSDRLRADLWHDSFMYISYLYWRDSFLYISYIYSFIYISVTWFAHMTHTHDMTHTHMTHTHMTHTHMTHTHDSHMTHTHDPHTHVWLPHMTHTHTQKHDSYTHMTRLTHMTHSQESHTWLHTALIHYSVSTQSYMRMHFALIDSWSHICAHMLRAHSLWRLHQVSYAHIRCTHWLAKLYMRIHIALIPYGVSMQSYMRKYVARTEARSLVCAYMSHYWLDACMLHYLTHESYICAHMLHSFVMASPCSHMCAYTLHALTREVVYAHICCANGLDAYMSHSLSHKVMYVHICRTHWLVCVLQMYMLIQYKMLQCAAVCCSVLQCVAVCCSDCHASFISEKWISNIMHTSWPLHSERRAHWNESCHTHDCMQMHMLCVSHTLIYVYLRVYVCVYVHIHI